MKISDGVGYSVNNGHDLNNLKVYESSEYKHFLSIYKNTMKNRFENSYLIKLLKNMEKINPPKVIS